MAPAHPVSPAGYPFELRVSVTWSVSAASLRCQLGAVNTGAAPAPFGVATHPFFRLPGARVDDLELLLAARKWLETDSNLLSARAAPG